jgi:hypothetical protein
MDDKELEIIDETIRWIPHTKVWDVATTIRKNIDVLEKGERIKLDKKKVGTIWGGKIKNDNNDNRWSRIYRIKSS